MNKESVYDKCCVVNCPNTRGNSKCEFYRFPAATAVNVIRRRKWIATMNRRNGEGLQWYPLIHHRICSDHFIGGRKSDDENSPSYIPTIFPPGNDAVEANSQFLAKASNEIHNIPGLQRETFVPEAESTSNKMAAENKMAASQNTVEANIVDKDKMDAIDGAQTEKKKDSGSVHLDKFKRRLIRAVARMIHEKKEEKDMWRELKLALGCDCRILWQYMRALTIKKLNRLLPANDLLAKISKVARFTATDWLLFDLILVHEKIVVIGSPEDEEPECLYDLFELVKTHRIEYLAGEDLIEAWIRVTLEYNSRGRQCSPMLLQRRWYQLKQVSRERFYNFWFSYRGNSRLLDQIMHLKPTELQTAIAQEYYIIITEHFADWEELIKSKLVILSEDFTTNRARLKAEKEREENETELECIEPEVETIDLGVDSDTGENDSDCDKIPKEEPSSTDVKEEEIVKTEDKVHKDSMATLKTVKPEPDDDVLELDGLSDVESMYIPSENVARSRENSTTEISDDDKLGNEETLPKITSVIGNAVKTEDCSPEDEVNEILMQKINEEKATLEATIDNNTKTMETEPVIDCDSDDEMNEILREKANNLMNIEITQIKSERDIPKPPDIEHRKGVVQIEPNTSIVDEHIVCDSDEEMDRILQEKAAQFRNTEGAQKTKELLPQITNISGNSTEENTNVDDAELTKHEDTIKEEKLYGEFDEFAFDTDGIEFEDDGIEFVEENVINKDNIINSIKKEIKIEIASDDEEQEDTGKPDDNPTIDLKLLMDPVVYTKKIDQMEVFKFTDFNYVNDKRVIDCAELESKPVDKKAIKAEDMEKFRAQALMENITDGQNDDDIAESEDDEEDRVKSTSWLLQKPKNRSYNPIQLCKNPDFNTRLKRLTAGFLSSTRNRFLLKECKPLTIDLHKAFETKLVDGTLYLKGGDFKSAKPTGEYLNNQPTVVPSAIPGQSIIFTANINNPTTDVSEVQTIDDQEDNLQRPLTSPIPQKHVPNERSRVINLPDIDQVRRTNQSLLTAEVTPIRIDSNNDKNGKQLNNETSTTLIESSQAETTIIEPDVAVPSSTLTDAPVVQVKKEPSDLNVNTETNSTNANKIEPEKKIDQIFSAKDSMANKINDQIINISKQIFEVDTNDLLTVDVGRTALSKPEVIKKGKGKKSKGEATKSVPSYKPNWVPLYQNNVTWKPKLPTNHLNDSLLTFGTLEKMLILFKGETVCKKKINLNISHQKTNLRELHQDMSNSIEEPKNTCDNAPIVPKRGRLTYKSTKKPDIADPNEGKEIVETVTQQEAKKKIKKPRATTAPQPKKYKGYFCCWAREKIMAYGRIAKIAPHPCLRFNCLCCCRNELNRINTIKQLKLKSDKVEQSSSTIILSDDENSNKSNETPIVYQKHSPETSMTGTSQVTTDKANKITIEVLPSPALETVGAIAETTNIVSTDSNMTAVNTLPSNEEKFSKKCKTVVHAAKRIQPIEPYVEKPKNDATVLAETAKRMLFLSSRHIVNKPAKSPIFLGKNKILLCTVKKPQPVLTPPELPAGVRFILMPDGELTVSTDPGVQLDSEQLSILPGLMAIIQQQLLKDLATNSINQQGIISALGTSEQSNIQNPTEITNNCTETQDISIQADLPTIGNDKTDTSQKDSIPVVSEVVETSNNSHNSTIVSNIDTQPHQGEIINEASNNVQPALRLKNIEELSEISNKSDNLTTEIPSNKPVEDLQAKDSDVTTKIQNIATETNADNQAKNSDYSLPTAEIGTTDNQDVNADKDSSNQNTQPRKTILSDLMEMSGISAEDSMLSDTTNYCPLPPNIIPVTRKVEAPVAMVNENISISGPYTNLLSFEPTNPTNRLLNYIGQIKPELNAVTSFMELKYAYENDGQFFKLDTVTGIISPINVCIKKNDKPQGPIEPKAVIDLTEDGDDVICTDSNTSEQHNVTFQVQAQTESTGVNQVKPIKLFKSIRPSILKHSVKSLKVRAVVQQKTYRAKKHSRKQMLQVNNVTAFPQSNKNPVVISETTDLTEVPAMTPLDTSYDSSDEEPLAKKSKRIKPADDINDCGTPEYLDLGSSDDEIYGMTEVPEIAEDMNEVDSSSMDIEGVNPELNPVAFEEGSESDEDMCILGV